MARWPTAQPDGRQWAWALIQVLPGTGLAGVLPRLADTRKPAKHTAISPGLYLAATPIAMKSSMDASWILHIGHCQSYSIWASLVSRMWAIKNSSERRWIGRKSSRYSDETVSALHSPGIPVRSWSCLFLNAWPNIATTCRFMSLAYFFMGMQPSNNPWTKYLVECLLVNSWQATQVVIKLCEVKLQFLGCGNTDNKLER